MRTDIRLYSYAYIAVGGAVEQRLEERGVIGERCSRKHENARGKHTPAELWYGLRKHKRKAHAS
jgi:hypothetical protein